MIAVVGIMDESGYLQEGQIYCSVHDPEGPVLTGNVVITRCPALHPGDVQCVDAVDVPQDSPLRALHNCVVFSQHGKRGKNPASPMICSSIDKRLVFDRPPLST